MRAKLHIISFIFQAFAVNGPALADTIQGTLYKKGTDWYCFVESEDAKFKKGSLKLLYIPKSYKKFLIQKAFVQIDGQKISTTQVLSMKVEKISLASFDPVHKK